MSPLEVDVLHNEITARCRDTNYMAIYYKPRDVSDLSFIAKRMSNDDDRRTSMTLSEFLGSAWWAANDKARELGCNRLCRAAGFGQRPCLYGDELQPRHSNSEAIRGMVFKLGVVSPTRRLGH